MNQPRGHINASNAHIDKVVQVVAPDNRGSISMPVQPGPGRSILTIDHAPALSHADNLVEASAQPNDNFVGRAKQLSALADLLQHAKEPVAVVIIAGAGFGKTELAKEFINRHAQPAPANADPEQLAANEWTARWWLDGSLGGEDASLRKHYTAITGQPFPPEPTPTAADDPAVVTARFRTRLRRDIAKACSTGRQLLVVDNAETTDQIKDYRPGNRGRLLATTRRQPIPPAVGKPFPLDEMSQADARTLLAGTRDDLRDATTGQPHAHVTAALDAIAAHMGHHALALAYAAALLARPPYKSPQAVLHAMQAADVGEEAHALAKFSAKELGTEYSLGLAQSLGLLLDELADAASPHRDPLALQLATLAAFCDPAAIPISLLTAASGEPEAKVEASLRALHERSIIILTDSVRMHRLTQSLLRGRTRAPGGDGGAAVLDGLLFALIALFAWPYTMQKELVDHVKTPARMAAVAHAEAVLVHAETLALPATMGAAPLFPGTSSRARAEVADKLATKAARLRADIAHRLWAMGQLADAARHIDSAIDWSETQSPRDERSLAIDYASRARIRQDRGDLAGAEADIKKSIDWEEAQSPRDERGLAIDYASRARIRRDRGDLAGAEADIKKSIDWGEAQSPRDERGLAIWYASRADIRRLRGDLAGAEADIKKSIAWEEAQSPRDERSLAIRYASRARIRQDRGDLAGAEADIKQSIDWGEAQSPRDERSLAIRYASQASIRRDRGDLAGAEDDIQKCIDWGEAKSPRDERTLAICYASRADIRKDRGDLAGAEADIQKSIDWGEAQSPRDERSLAFWYETKAFILAKANKFPQAKATIDESVRLHTAVFGADHEWTQITIRRRQAIHAERYPG